ncbi:MAG: hypothetical protein ACFFB2_04685 [Promethearchaeota archaeon]
MAIGKDQALTPGEFFPSSDKTVIYRCYLRNTSGFLRNSLIFTVLFGFFAFLFVQWSSFLIVPFTWLFIIPWLVPKHYRFVQINKYAVAYGIGSIFSLFQSRMKSIYKVEKSRYNDIHYLKLDRWQRKKIGGKIDSFGRIEIKIADNKPIFQILIETTDLIQLIKVLESHRFQSKVQKKLLQAELVLIFPPSHNYIEE